MERTDQVLNIKPTSMCAETKNRGFEFTLNTRNIVTKDFEWTSSVAFVYQQRGNS